jgi:hypothetical protein
VKRHFRDARGLLPLLALAGALALAVGCSETPVVAPYDNPFDPDGVNGGDPFELVAVYYNGAVLLSWNSVGGGVVKYLVLHSLDGTAYTDVDTVQTPAHNYAHHGFAANRMNWYKIRALDAADRGSDISSAVAASFMAPPRLDIGDTTFAASRYTVLHFAADLGDTVEVDSLPDFSTAVLAALDESGLVDVDWDLGAAVTPTDWKHIHYRVLVAGARFPAWHDSLQVRFDPTFTLLGTPATVASLRPVLRIGGQGVTDMRFAAGLADLADVEPFPAAATYDGYELSALPDTQTVYAEFFSDFGITTIDSLIAAPDSLRGVAVVINGGSDGTSADALTVYVDARATEMRAAATLGELAATPWIPYAPTFSFVHDGCASDLVKTVHVQLRNDWFVADPVSDAIQWLPPEALAATIDDPGELGSGQAITLTGTAAPGTCSAPLDLVEVNDGGDWAAATGLESWSYAWTAPTVVDTMTVTLRVRVTAGAEVHESELDVVVNP